MLFPFFWPVKSLGFEPVECEDYGKPEKETEEDPGKEGFDSAVCFLEWNADRVDGGEGWGVLADFDFGGEELLGHRGEGGVG